MRDAKFILLFVGGLIVSLFTVGMCLFLNHSIPRIEKRIDAIPEDTRESIVTVLVCILIIVLFVGGIILYHL